MYTQCPACRTVYRISSKELRQARGRVRCGRCDKDFNALETLSEAPPATPPPPDQGPRPGDEPPLSIQDTGEHRALNLPGDLLAGPGRGRADDERDSETVGPGWENELDYHWQDDWLPETPATSKARQSMDAPETETGALIAADAGSPSGSEPALSGGHVAPEPIDSATEPGRTDVLETELRRRFEPELIASAADTASATSRVADDIIDATAARAQHPESSVEPASAPAGLTPGGEIPGNTDATPAASCATDGTRPTTADQGPDSVAPHGMPTATADTARDSEHAGPETDAVDPAVRNGTDAGFEDPLWDAIDDRAHTESSSYTEDWAEALLREIEAEATGSVAAPEITRPLETDLTDSAATPETHGPFEADAAGNATAPETHDPFEADVAGDATTLDTIGPAEADLADGATTPETHGPFEADAAGDATALDTIGPAEAAHAAGWATPETYEPFEADVASSVAAPETTNSLDAARDADDDGQPPASDSAPGQPADEAAAATQAGEKTPAETEAPADLAAALASAEAGNLPGTGTGFSSTAWSDDAGSLQLESWIEPDFLDEIDLPEAIEGGPDVSRAPPGADAQEPPGTPAPAPAPAWLDRFSEDEFEAIELPATLDGDPGETDASLDGDAARDAHAPGDSTAAADRDTGDTGRADLETAPENAGLALPVTKRVDLPRELDPTSAPRGRRWRVPAIAVLLLAAALGGVHMQRAVLMRNAALAPTLERVYGALGVTINARWDVGAFRILQSSASAGAGGRLTVDARFANGASFAQPFPVLRVTLENRWGQALERRDFDAGAYLAGGAPGRRMRPEERTDARVVLPSPGDEAVGFSVDLCLGANDDDLACLSENPGR